MVGSAEGSGQLTYTQVDAQVEYKFLAIVPLEMNNYETPEVCTKGTNQK